jgi:hypothetical protein
MMRMMILYRYSSRWMMMVDGIDSRFEELAEVSYIIAYYGYRLPPTSVASVPFMHIKFPLKNGYYFRYLS